MSRHVCRGALAIEAACVLAVVIVAVMMLVELVHIGLTISMGHHALDNALQQLRHDDPSGPPASDMAARLRTLMVAGSHGCLGEDEIAVVRIDPYASLDEHVGSAWRISVDLRKRFVTPLPRLMGIRSQAFRYLLAPAEH
ncbi:MAG: hypothetical protein QM586_01225 [Xenophilus sp.]